MNKARIIITGAAGRLGKALCRAYADGFDVVALDRKRLDLASSASVEKVFSDLEFDIVINCAALTNVDYCETNEAEANRINGDAPGQIAEIAKSNGARMIQIISETVFFSRSGSGFYPPRDQ